MQRITLSQLKHKVSYLNQITNNPSMAWKQIHGKLVGQIGHYHLAQAYGGYSLNQTMNEGGGVRDIIRGYRTKREVYEWLDAFIQGIELSQEQTV